jgi:hypothetical protein
MTPTFSLGLVAPEPADDAAGPAHRVFDPTRAHRHPLRILIADDSVINQRVAATMLTKDGL